MIAKRAVNYPALPTANYNAGNSTVRRVKA
jgi:hypothetical protein